MHIRRFHRNIRKKPLSRGFTLIEVALASLMLTVVSVALLALFTNTVMAVKYSQQDMIARQKARQALEMVLSAKTIGQLTWDVPTATDDQIENVGTSAGVFLTGWNSLQLPGPDGLVGTADDTGTDSYYVPGPSGVLGAADSIQIPLTNFQRQITITPLTIGGSTSTTLREIQVSVRYPISPNSYRTYTVNSYLSKFQ